MYQIWFVPGDTLSQYAKSISVVSAWWFVMALYWNQPERGRLLPASEKLWARASRQIPEA